MSSLTLDAFLVETCKPCVGLTWHGPSMFKLVIVVGGWKDQGGQRRFIESQKTCIEFEKAPIYS